jgi:hypothetical protein
MARESPRKDLLMRYRRKTGVIVCPAWGGMNGKLGSQAEKACF